MPSRGAALHHFPHRSARLLAAAERPVGLRQSKESFQQPAEKILGHSRIASPPTPPSRHKVERHPEISSLRSNGWAIRSASPRIGAGPRTNSGSTRAPNCSDGRPWGSNQPTPGAGGTGGGKRTLFRGGIPLRLCVGHMPNDVRHAVGEDGDRVDARLHEKLCEVRMVAGGLPTEAH